MKNVFLTEILTEELPEKKLKHLAEKFLEQVISEFNLYSIIYKKSYWFASPRRLAVKFTNVKIRNKKIFYKKDLCFSKKEYHSHKSNTSNFIGKKKFFPQRKKIKKLLYKVIHDVLINFESVTKMKWSNKNISFIRPIRSIILIFNDQLINGKILNVKIDRILYGHRFIGKRKIYLEHANFYLDVLLKEKVMVDFFQRKDKIIQEVKNISYKIGGIVKIDDVFLEEIVSLTEWPVALYSNFDEIFLSIPKGILIFILQKKQKCFPVFDKHGNLLPYFIFIVNLESKNTEKIATIYKNVIHSCFSNIKFLLNVDKEKKLIDRLYCLDNIIFHNLLGSLRDKSKRIANISNFIANLLNVNKEDSSRAGLLCKCDLVTNMVIEFPEMRGMIGMYYSIIDGESEEVSISQKYHYYPRFSDDILPSTIISCIVSIADKIDTLVGMIGIGEIPKQGKDPFALRRAAIGIIRIIIEKRLTIDLYSLVKETIEIYENKLIKKNIKVKVCNFILHRLLPLYKEDKYDKKIIQSIILSLPYQESVCILDLHYRILAIYELFINKKISVLILMSKRINNMLKKYCNDIGENLNKNLLISIEEINVSNLLTEINRKIPILIKDFKYGKFLIYIKKLCTLLNLFFKNVLIITNEKSVMKNRLHILKISRDIFLKITDFSKL